MMDARMRELIPTLTMISKINPGDKLLVKRKRITIDGRWGRSGRRMWDGESREVTLHRLTEIYNEIRQKAALLVHELDFFNEERSRRIPAEDLEKRTYSALPAGSRSTRTRHETERILQRLGTAVGKSKRGIQNLITTYGNDTNTEAQLELLLENDVKDIYLRISESLPDEFKPEICGFEDQSLPAKRTTGTFHVKQDDFGATGSRQVGQRLV